MDILSISGLFVAFGAILLGQFLEGGHIETLVNGPAVLIVAGGTLGAVMLQSPLPVFMNAIRMLRWLFLPPGHPLVRTAEELMQWSRVARKEGLLGLEAVVGQQSDPFAKKGLQLLIDGNEPNAIRGTLELEIATREEFDLAGARVFDGMGGYAPTIGIIGAVMGLIHVMGNLADPAQLGGGIAVAFVATIYGVALANLVFLPAANKLKALIRQQALFREMITEGLVAIAEGENPHIVELRLRAFLS
jgi:chemotaxis protein MotA